MALERDNQHIIAAVSCGVLTLNKAANYTGSAIDTKGMRALSFVIIRVQGTLDPGDDIQFEAEESADGINWTVVPNYKKLPSEHYPDQYVVDPILPYHQVCGVVCSERYVRPILNCSAWGGQRVAIYKLYAIMFPEQLAFRAWDPESIVGDGQP